MKWFLALLIPLVGCAHAPPPPPIGGQTIDPNAYLTWSGPAVAQRDLPAPNGFEQAAEAVGPRGPETLWKFSTAPGFDASAGDGGEVYAVANHIVTIILTQDGGTAYLQSFQGGTGWVVFRDDATPQWESLVATLCDTQAGTTCNPTSEAYTRYEVIPLSLPWIENGALMQEQASTVISEHYDASTIAAAQHMERSYFVQGKGRMVWEAWGRTGTPASADRCPGNDLDAPTAAAGWTEYDCRYTTQIVDGATLDAATFGWPP